jgi:hypothetical protein
MFLSLNKISLYIIIMSALLSRNPKEWGPIYWKMLSTIIEAYPPSNPSNELQASTITFFESLKYLLPCQVCRENYSKFLKDNHVAVLDRQNLMTWFNRMKRHVGETNTNTESNSNSNKQATPLKARTRLVHSNARLQPRRVTATATGIGTHSSHQSRSAAANRMANRAIRANATKKGCNCGNSK